MLQLSVVTRRSIRFRTQVGADGRAAAPDERVAKAPYQRPESTAARGEIGPFRGSTIRAARSRKPCGAGRDLRGGSPAFRLILSPAIRRVPPLTGPGSGQVQGVLPFTFTSRYIEVNVHVTWR